MKSIKLIFSSLLVGAACTGCVDILDENVNPDAATGISVEDGLPTVLYYAAQTNYDHAEYGIYLSQCLTTTGKSPTGATAYKSGWEFLTMNRHPQWRRHYYDIGANINELLRNAEPTNTQNYILIARTIRLLSTQLTTDAFGDMPLSKAYTSNNPTYDAQSDIYAWMLSEADALIAAYNDPAYTEADGNKRITAAQDRVYAGNLHKWSGLVYAIKARLLLRNIPNVDTSAPTCQAIYDAAAAAIRIWQEDPTYGTFFGSEPRYNFDGGTQQQNSPWSSAQPVVNSWESRANLLTEAVPSRFLMESCLGVFNKADESKAGSFVAYRGFGDDPRIALLFKPRTGPASATNSTAVVKLRWLDNNIGSGTSYKAANYPDLYAGAYAGSSDSYVPLFTMEELYFIQAEAKYWMGEKTEACRLAKEATRYNIQRHLEAFQKAYPEVMYPGNVTATGDYQKLDMRDRGDGVFDKSKARWEAVVNAFIENQDQEGEKVVPVKRVTDPSVKGNNHWFFNPSEFTLSDLMKEKYVAMYMQPEQWTDMRRYHYSNKRNNYGIGTAQEIVYPELRRPYNLYAPYWIDGLSETEKENTWIERINYDPETEEKYNRPELERLGAYRNYKWLQKPMIWSEAPGVRTSLTK